MRCAACGHDNLPDSRFCNACGAALDLVCPGCQERNPAGARFCRRCAASLGATVTVASDPRAYTPRHLAEKILTSRSALQGERKQVTVLFADVKGSMDLAERVDPEAWHGILDRFFAILADGVHRFEGTINQFTGDGIMALFGAPIAHEDHAQRACHAALHLAEALGRYGRELRRTAGLNFSVRMGINSGEVVVGAIGDDLRMDYTAQGHTVGLASRMEQLAEAGTVYLTEATAALVAGYFRLEDLGAFAIKGVREPLRVYELRGVGALRTRFDVARSRGFSRFVGRDEEAAALEEALARALAGDGRVVGVVGEPGVGKSRLCHEFLQRCRMRGIPVHQAQGLAHAKNVPFHILLELTRDYFGITDRDSDQAAREKIAGRLLLLDRELDEVLPLAFEFLGVPDPERPPPRLDAEARQRQLFEVARRVVPARSRREPAVFLIEDLHWVDGGSETFVEMQAGLVPGTRTLLVVNFRPEYRAAWTQSPHCRLLPLAPLGQEATAELLRDLLGADSSLAALADTIRERTRGNPFFVEEVVQTLVEAGNLEGARGAYRLARPVDEVAVPASVQAVLSARIDRLPEREKAVLQTAAVIGKRFAEPVLRRVTAVSEADLAAALRTLTEAQLLFEEAVHPEPAYAFKHRLTQEVAYHSLLGERRARVHVAVARALGELYPDKLDQRAALIAHHWEGAGEALEAARWSRRAAEWVRGTDLAEALRHWRNVRTLAARLPASPERTTLTVEACIQLLEIGWRHGVSPEEADALFAEGQALATRDGDRRALAMLINARAAHVETAHEFVDCSLEATRLADETDDAALRLAVRARLVVALVDAGSLREALVMSEQVAADSPSDLRLGAAILGYSPYIRVTRERGRALLDLGRVDEGLRHLERAARLAREAGDLELLGLTHWEYVTLARIRGDAETALAHAREAMRIAERLGSPFFRAGACLSFGQAHILGAQWGEALAALEETLRITAAGQARFTTAALALAWIAAAHLGLGDLPRARAAADAAVVQAERRGTRPAECIAHIGRARVMLRTDPTGLRAAIGAALGRALALIEETGARSNEPFVRVQLARLAGLTGDRVTWERELREAHRLFTEMGAVPRAEKLAHELNHRQPA